MPLRFHTASYRYDGPDRLDVTRVGVERAAKAGHEAPGAPWAPSSRVLWPAKAHLDLVAALERRAASLPAGEAAATTALYAQELLAKTEAAYERLYTSELRASYRAHRGAWDGLLARDTVTVVCFCARREPGDDQRHHCHRHHLAAALVKCGAIDLGERELPPPEKPAKPRQTPLLEAFVAVSGTRPPKPDAPRELHTAFRAILGDVARTVAVLPAGTVVVHGGADGVDSEAGRAAKVAGLGELVYRPWYDAFERAAPIVRNVYVASATRCLAWPSSWGRGTQQAIELARAAGVDVDVHAVG